jgi:hypothetical protein
LVAKPLQDGQHGRASAPVPQAGPKLQKPNVLPLYGGLKPAQVWAALCPARPRREAEKALQRDAEVSGKAYEPVDRNSVPAVFVLLELLETDFEMSSHLFLRFSS